MAANGESGNDEMTPCVPFRMVPDAFHLTILCTPASFLRKEEGPPGRVCRGEVYTWRQLSFSPMMVGRVEDLG